jgi:hypothetical protein
MIISGVNITSLILDKGFGLAVLRLTSFNVYSVVQSAAEVDTLPYTPLLQQTGLQLSVEPAVPKHILSRYIRLMDEKQLENVESFKYLGTMLTNDGRCTCEITSRIGTEKVAFNKKMAPFTSKMDLERRRKLVKCYILSIA